MCRIVTRYWIGVAANDHVEKGVALTLRGNPARS
jgi:hypothetical protein